jgi:hypothetical protein
MQVQKVQIDACSCGSENSATRQTSPDQSFNRVKFGGIQTDLSPQMVSSSEKRGFPNLCARGGCICRESKAALVCAKKVNSALRQCSQIRPIEYADPGRFQIAQPHKWIADLLVTTRIGLRRIAAITFRERAQKMRCGSFGMASLK